MGQSRIKSRGIVVGAIKKIQMGAGRVRRKIGVIDGQTIVDDRNGHALAGRPIQSRFELDINIGNTTVDANVIQAPLVGSVSTRVVNGIVKRISRNCPLESLFGKNRLCGNHFRVGGNTRKLGKHFTCRILFANRKIGSLTNQFHRADSATLLHLLHVCSIGKLYDISGAEDAAGIRVALLTNRIKDQILLGTGLGRLRHDRGSRTRRNRRDLQPS
ncbi:hypothetical protein OAE72_01965 [Akkermansiaceae bacterium]|nr:hypothetical protein [Akkermansiaceae bacterium]